ncbi:MAG: hypothetical protein M1812_003695 [Candelaria pacifica]|nr:MAG: hypothetical protein M1812_003695 [Candelaria pacifica]
MHDLRRQALESGKTVSKKAQARLSRPTSRAASRTNSAANSRANSRAPSRQGSDDEEGDVSDGTTWSMNSIDEFLGLEESDLPTEAWATELGDRIDQIIDRKRSSVQGREESLAIYVRILTAQYAREEIHHKLGQIVSAFLKSIKAETSEKETVLALKALVLTIVTDPSDTIYDAVLQPLKRTISDSESLLSKTAAIHALGAAAFFGGASDDEMDEIMVLLLDIVSSDGHSVSAGDNASVVTAALEEWGFLATQLEDLEEASEDAMEAFVEQLDSSEPSVQIAAGENIALMYEKSYTELEADEEFSSPEEDSDPEDDALPDGPKMVKRYTPYRREDQLKRNLSSLANLSTRRLSKKDKKSLHTNFADILNSVENPTRGPRYQNAVNQETGKRYGSRMTVRIHRTGVMRIDRWWKLLRLKALRRALQGGFVAHYESNAVVFECLP